MPCWITSFGVKGESRIKCVGFGCKLVCSSYQDRRDVAVRTELCKLGVSVLFVLKKLLKEGVFDVFKLASIS